MPGVHAGLPVMSLEVWADQHQIVHRVAVTFRGTERVSVSFLLSGPKNAAQLYSLGRVLAVANSGGPSGRRVLAYTAVGGLA
jgi:hypothetical protein